MRVKDTAILVVDDKPSNLKVLLAFLIEQNFEIRTAENGTWALQVLETYQPDIILLDVMMPGMDGFETCRRIKATKDIADIPVIFMTALDSVESKIAGFEAGGVDYITKPFQEVEVLARVNTHVTLRKQKLMLLDVSKKEEEFKRIESLKTMAGAIAHRFNNAMMAVLGNLDLLTCTLPDDSSEYQMASDASQAAKGASQVGSMMLSYVGQNSLQLQALSLANLVNESITALKSFFPSTITLNFIPPDQALYCSIDQLQIKEVVKSILTNAVESLENSSGTIEITFGTDYFTTASFPVAFQNDKLKDGMYSFCQIKDSGQGISPENLSRIFEPFYTTRFVGRGLGLALTVGIMQTHHGAITVESNTEKGTTVKVLLPPIDSSLKQRVHSSDAAGSKVIQLSGDILLAEDETMVLDVGRNMLNTLGFTVHTARNGKEAVDKVQKSNIDFRAVILDFSMPKMNGIEAMQAIRKINPALFIILTSGHSEDFFSFKDEQSGKPDIFLSKPFQLSDMRSSLAKLLC